MKRSAGWLAERGIEGARLDAELLIAHALGVQRVDLYVQHDRPLQESELAAIRPLVRARGARKPVAYILGTREFYSLTFAVDERVLIPRPETEGLVELALKCLEGQEAPRFVDIGTGSGCVAVALAHERPGATGVAIDLSSDALVVARANAERHGVADRIRFVEGDGLAPLGEPSDAAGYDAVLANPPYIAPGDDSVAPDVHEYEPHVALYVASGDALGLVERFAREALRVLRPGGLLAMEVGFRDGAEAVERLGALGYSEASIEDDLAGIPRIVHGVR